MHVDDKANRDECLFMLYYIVYAVKHYIWNSLMSLNRGADFQLCEKWIFLSNGKWFELTCTIDVLMTRLTSSLHSATSGLWSSRLDEKARRWDLKYSVITKNNVFLQLLSFWLVHCSAPMLQHLLSMCIYFI